MYACLPLHRFGRDHRFSDVVLSAARKDVRHQRQRNVHAGVACCVLREKKQQEEYFLFPPQPARVQRRARGRTGNFRSFSGPRADDDAKNIRDRRNVYTTNGLPR